MKYRLWLLPAAALLLPSCMVGPNYVRPAAPNTPGYKEPPPQAYKGDEIWKPVHPSDRALRTAWWELFGNDELNSLEQQVAGANQELKAAEARFREARALVGFARADEFPTIGVGPGISSLRESPNQPYFPLASSFATGELVLPVDLSYEIDLWGRIRRGVAAAGEKADCVISADPVAFLLLGFGRVSQLSPLLRGQLRPGGRKPWLAMKFGSLLYSP